jgi:hypothetical protein
MSRFCIEDCVLFALFGRWWGEGSNEGQALGGDMLCFFRRPTSSRLFLITFHPPQKLGVRSPRRKNLSCRWAFSRRVPWGARKDSRIMDSLLHRL